MNSFFQRPRRFETDAGRATVVARPGWGASKARNGWQAPPPTRAVLTLTLLRSNSRVMGCPAISETSAAASDFLVGYPEYSSGRRIEVRRGVIAPSLVPEIRVEVVDQATGAAR